MVESDEFTIDGDTGAVRLTSYSSYGEPTELMDAWTLMQYTGLKDKNGKEIYEGDIVGDGINPQTDALVQWKDDEARWSFYSQGYHFSAEDGLDKDDYVIGNIHENPELLEND